MDQACPLPESGISFTGISKLNVDAYIARQPIFTRDRSVFGYELLFRAGPDNAFGGACGDSATTSLISDLVHVHGIESLTGDKVCFINVTRQALIDEVYSALPPERTVVEVLETVDPDKEVLDACQRVRKAGYLLALDDYVLDPRFQPLLRHLDILKVEFPKLTTEQRRKLRSLRRRHGFQLLAEKVEEPECFKEGQALGYDLFQGYFFCKPEMMQSKRLPSSRVHYLRFLQTINDDNAEVSEIERLIRQQVSLSYKLLRYLNSAAFGLRAGVKSVRHAITLLGLKELRRWASLVAVNEMIDDKPAELMNACLIRARCCEQVANQLGGKRTGAEVFMLGMFSLLDAMLDRPMVELVKELALPEKTRLALCGDATCELLDYVRLAVGFERGDWDTIAEAASRLGIHCAVAYQVYREALIWAGEVMQELTGVTGASSTSTAA